MLEGAGVALLPGDPGRVANLASLPPFTNPKELAYHREFRSMLTTLGDHRVLVTSTGIGGPSTAIVIDELAQLGIRAFLRVGTTGAIQPGIEPGEIIITTGAVRLDGASTHYAPIEYPAVAHYHMVQALIQASQELSIPYHAGVTASTDTFYPGQERKGFSGYIPLRFEGQTEELRRLHVLNYEMESATVLTLTSCMGLIGGCVEGVVINRTSNESINPEDLKLGEHNATRVAVKAIEILFVNEGIGGR